MDAAAEFQQLKLQFVDPIQHDYEVIRPIVLFSDTVTERSKEVDMARTSVGAKAGRFVREGMLGLVDQRTTSTSNQLHEYPPPVAAHILYLKQSYPPILPGNRAYPQAQVRLPHKPPYSQGFSGTASHPSTAGVKLSSVSRL